MKKLIDFIDSERNRFEIRHDNMFAKGFREIIRYYQFLNIISERHQQVVKEYADNFTNFQNSMDKTPGAHTYTDKQMLMDRESIRLGDLVQLEIESFYQFAKILLDKTAVAVEFYFGKIDTNRIGEHHRLVEKKDNGDLRKIEVYANDKSLKITSDLIEIMVSLQRDVSDFRDKYITHLQSPRTIRGTSIDGRQVIRKIYPTHENNTVLQESKSLNELKNEIEKYIELLVEFIKNNREKTGLNTNKS